MELKFDLSPTLQDVYERAKALSEAYETQAERLADHPDVCTHPETSVTTIHDAELEICDRPSCGRVLRDELNE